MRIRTKLDKLEKAAQQHCEVLRLPDGTQVRCSSEDLLEALSATIAGEDHWLLPAARETDSHTGLLGLVAALERSRERAATEEEEEEEALEE